MKRHAPLVVTTQNYKPIGKPWFKCRWCNGVLHQTKHRDGTVTYRHVRTPTREGKPFPAQSTQ